MMKKIQALEENQSSGGDNIELIIKRAYSLLDEGDFASATSTAERILDRDSKNVTGYVIKLLADLKLKKLDELQILFCRLTAINIIKRPCNSPMRS